MPGKNSYHRLPHRLYGGGQDHPTPQADLCGRETSSAAHGLSGTLDDRLNISHDLPFDRKERSRRISEVSAAFAAFWPTMSDFPLSLTSLEPQFILSHDGWMGNLAQR